MTKNANSDAVLRRLHGRTVYEEAPLTIRLVFALFSFILPGLGQALQHRSMKALDFLLIHGASMLFATIFAIQLHLGIWTLLIMAGILLIPAVWSCIDAFMDKVSPGDADTVVRNVFLYIFFYLITLGPYHFINYTVGFKVYVVPTYSNYLEPALLPGDAVVFDRDAYGLRTPGMEMHPDSVHIGDIVYCTLPNRRALSADTRIYWVLAGPGDTLISDEGTIKVNGKVIDIPKPDENSSSASFGPRIVPNNQVFLGDNRKQLFPVYIRKIDGRAMNILWSIEDNGKPRWERFAIPVDQRNIFLNNDISH